MERDNSNPNLQNDYTGCSIPVHGDVLRARSQQSYNNPKRDDRYKRNRHYKYLPAVIALLFATPVNANDVGGVSATASPIANSSEAGDQPGYPGFTRPIYH